MIRASGDLIPGQKILVKLDNVDVLIYRIGTNFRISLVPES